jgi:hypothetical protein
MNDTNNPPSSAEPHAKHHLQSAPDTFIQPPPRTPYQERDLSTPQDLASTISSSSTSTWDIIEAHLPSNPRPHTSAFPELDAALQSANTALTTVTAASSTLVATLSHSTLSHTTLSLAASATTSASTNGCMGRNKDARRCPRIRAQRPRMAAANRHARVRTSTPAEAAQSNGDRDKRTQQRLHPTD